MDGPTLHLRMLTLCLPQSAEHDHAPAGSERVTDARPVIATDSKRCALRIHGEADNSSPCQLESPHLQH